MENQEKNWMDPLLDNQENSGTSDMASIDAKLDEILAEDWAEATPAQPAEEAFDPYGYVPEEDPAEPQEEADAPQELPPIGPTDYIRPQKKKTYAFFGIPHLITTVIWILLIVIVGLSLGRALWICCAEVMAFGKENHQVTISISRDDSIDQVADKLGKANLIGYPALFKTFADLTGKSDNIRPGTYTLNAMLDYNAMINAMSSSGAREVVSVMFPEGYTCAQIFALLEEKGVCTVADMEKFLETYDPESGDLDNYWFLDGIKWGDKYVLEGYLAPDTYEFYTNDSPERILTKFLDEFDDRFTDIMKEDFEDVQYKHMEALHKEGYSNQYIEEHKLTLHNVLTLASIVQRETGSSSESFDIASVFYNRLAAGMELGSDATVYYAIGDYTAEKSELTKSDLNTDSPYNTRKNRGLPPGPICNPGTYALYAALDPNDTDFKYFVYDAKAEEHLFSKTIEEHEQKCQELGLW